MKEEKKDIKERREVITKGRKEGRLLKKKENL